MSNNGESPRLDRIEKIIEVIANVQLDMQQEHQLLLRAQVAQADEMQQLKKQTESIKVQTDLKFQALAESQQRMTEAQQRTTEAQQRMDDALTALMGTVDEIIRSRKN